MIGRGCAYAEGGRPVRSVLIAAVFLGLLGASLVGGLVTHAVSQRAAERVLDRAADHAVSMIAEALRQHMTEARRFVALGVHDSALVRALSEADRAAAVKALGDLQALDETGAVDMLAAMPLGRAGWAASSWPLPGGLDPKAAMSVVPDRWTVRDLGTAGDLWLLYGLPVDGLPQQPLMSGLLIAGLSLVDNPILGEAMRRRAGLIGLTLSYRGNVLLSAPRAMPGTVRGLVGDRGTVTFDDQPDRPFDVRRRPLAVGGGLPELEVVMALTGVRAAALADDVRGVAWAIGFGVLAALTFGGLVAWHWLVPPIEALGRRGAAVSRGSLPEPWTVWGLREVDSGGAALSALADAVVHKDQFRFAVLRGSGLPIIVADKDGRITEINAVAEAVTGMERDRALGRPLDSLFPGLDNRPFRDAARAALAGSQPLPVEAHSQIGWGEKRRYQWRIMPLTESCTGRVEGVVALGHDVSRLSDAERAEALNALVLDQIGEGVVVCDAAGRIIRVNTAALTLGEWREDDLLGHELDVLQAEVPGSPVERAMKTALAETGCWRGETRLRRRVGDPFPARLTLARLAEAGKRSGIGRGPGGGSGAGRGDQTIAVFSDLGVLRAAQQRAEDLAHFDPVTRLPNRTLLYDRLRTGLNRAELSARPLALILIDLDHFTRVNETQGHDAGDTLLAEAAARLGQTLGSQDVLARLGGDEFAIMLVDPPSRDAVAERAAALVTLMAQPLPLYGQNQYLSASIGVALFPEHGGTPDVLLRNADAALHQVKNTGRNGWTFFDSDMNRRAVERLILENSMRRGLEDGEFTVYFQALTDLDSGRVVGAEALARWLHRHEGVISPGRFIPVAEDSGLIGPLGSLVLRQAVREAAAWEALLRQQGAEGTAGADSPVPVPPVSVNLSVRQFRSPTLVADIADALRDAGLPASRLRVEVTESLIMEDVTQAAETLQQLKAMGVGVAVDDFGTGYSSLATLKTLPVDVLKIDRAFVRDLATAPVDAAIVTAIVTLARALGVQVVAEGVETAEQARILRECGCRVIQGFLMSRPVAAADFRRSLQAAAAWPPQPVA